MASEDLKYNPQMFVYKYVYSDKTTERNPQNHDMSEARYLARADFVSISTSHHNKLIKREVCVLVLPLLYEAEKANTLSCKKSV